MEVSQVDVVEEEAPVEKIKNTKKPFKSGYVVGLLLFLVVCLIGGLTYFVLKERGIDLLVKDVEDNDIEAQQMCTTGSEEGSCKVALDNKGWALFSLPDYEFSVEVPSYTATQKLGGYDVDYKWTYEQGVETVNIFLPLDDYVRTVKMSYYPENIPADAEVGGGGGSLNEHSIKVNIIQNKAHKSVLDVSKQYKDNFDTEIGDGGEVKLTGEIANKWGMNVWSYVADYIESKGNGFLVVTDNYIYDISYHISTEPVASVQIAQKILDSMKFEKSSDTSVSVVYMGDGGDVSKKFVDYVYFLESAKMKAFLIDKKDVILDESKIGKTFLLTYDVATNDMTVGDTSYWIVSGAFTYVQQ